MREDRRYINNISSLKPLLSKVRRIGKKTAKKTNLIQQIWESVMSKERLPYTSIIEFKNNILVVAISNPALRSELEMTKQGIITALNASDTAEQTIFVRELIFRIG